MMCCCTRKSAQLPSNKVEQNPTQMDMMTYNKMCIEAENAEIQSFLDSSSVKFTKAETLKALIPSYCLPFNFASLPTIAITPALTTEEPKEHK